MTYAVGPTTRSSLADYYRLGTVTIRVGRKNTPPVCLTCRRNDCAHVEEFEDAISTGAIVQEAA